MKRLDEWGKSAAKQWRWIFRCAPDRSRSIMDERRKYVLRKKNEKKKRLRWGRGREKKNHCKPVVAPLLLPTASPARPAWLAAATVHASIAACARQCQRCCGPSAGGCTRYGERGEITMGLFLLRFATQRCAYLLKTEGRCRCINSARVGRVSMMKVRREELHRADMLLRRRLQACRRADDVQQYRRVFGPTK